MVIEARCINHSFWSCSSFLFFPAVLGAKDLEPDFVFFSVEEMDGGVLNGRQKMEIFTGKAGLMYVDSGFRLVSTRPPSLRGFFLQSKRLSIRAREEEAFF
jgi:hypothetical protein